MEYRAFVQERGGVQGERLPGILLPCAVHVRHAHREHFQVRRRLLGGYRGRQGRLPVFLQGERHGLPAAGYFAIREHHADHL